MNPDFIITKLHRVILVDKNEYKEQTTVFEADACTNELIYHVSGEAVVYFNGKRLETSPDCVRFLPAGPMNEYRVERKEHGACIDVFFDTDVPVADEAFCLKIRQSEKIKMLFQKIFSVWVAKGDGYYFECLALLYRIFALLQKKTYLPEAQYRHIKPAVDYVKAHFNQRKITAETIGACCDVSYPYIKKLFVLRFGVPPVQYAIRLKLHYACDLLQSGRYSVSETAEACGYTDANYFSRQFKEYVGCSPTDFIKKHVSSK